MKKPAEFHYLGHHMPMGRDGIEIRVYEDARGYYASTIFNPAGRCPADVGPFDTSFQALSAGYARHGIELVGNDNVAQNRLRRANDDRAMSMAW